jgi:hypothetical protein
MRAAGSYEARQVAGHLSISLDGQPVPVPAQATARLLDPHRLDLVESEGSYQLSIEGADGAESYRAILLFDRQGLYHRELASFEGEVLERTDFDRSNQ